MKVKFYLDQYISPSEAKYQHHAVALAEGFQELGIEFYGNIDYWFEPGKSEFLFKKSPPDFKPDISIYTASFFTSDPGELSKVNFSDFTILIDTIDGYDGLCLYPEFTKFKLILRVHYSAAFNELKFRIPGRRYGSNYKLLRYGKNVHPWAFGLTNRIVGSVAKTEKLPVKDQVLVNYRVAHNLRLKAYSEMSGILSSKYPMYNNITSDSDPYPAYSAQTGRRHSENYYKDLNESILTFAVAGWLMLKPFAPENNYLATRLYYSTDWRIEKLSKLIPDNFLMIQNWDTWRPWETFISNTCPVQVDYDYWGFVLPVMPEKYVHYWPVEGIDFSSAAKKILDSPKEKLIQIGQQGKKWALENYSSLPTAKRLINLVTKNNI